MKKEEIRKHLYELSPSEIQYRDHPDHPLNSFYLLLEEMGLKDENGVFVMPEKLILEVGEKRGSRAPATFWGKLDSSIHQKSFLLKKASRFYREPFMYADFVAIRYVYSGECIIYTPNRKLVLKENDAILMNCGFIVSQHLKNENDIVFTFLFKRDYIADRLKNNKLISSEITQAFFDYINRKDSLQLYRLYHGNDSIELRDTMDAILCEFLDPLPYGGDILLDSLMNVFLIQLTNCESENDFEYKEDASRIAGMLNYINLNYRDVDLNILSDRFGYNSKYISRFFKKLTGVSFKDYIFKKKLNSFCNTLLNSDMPIRDILLQENISSESYFFNRFKEIYGCSPAEYRKLH